MHIRTGQGEREMNKILHGIQKHEVILIQGDDIRPLLDTHVFAHHPSVTFSALNMSIPRVTTCLSSTRWDGTRPVVAFFRCEWTQELLALIRSRQTKQAVLLVTDGDYTAQTPQLKRLADSHVVLGKRPPTIFTLLKRGPLHERYRQAIECTGMHTVINQIHYSNTDFDVSCALSDVDYMQYRVPEPMLCDCLPFRKSIEFTSNKKIETKTAASHHFVHTIKPMVGLTRGDLMSGHDMMEYLRYAYQIQQCPQFAQYPRDDRNPTLVKNVNAKIRVLVCMPIDTNKRKRGVATRPASTDP